MIVYNIAVVELDERDLQRAATNGGLTIPLAPDTRSINFKGMLQNTKEPEKSTKQE
jgi:hypothetical protein